MIIDATPSTLAAAYDRAAHLLLAGEPVVELVITHPGFTVWDHPGERAGRACLLQRFAPAEHTVKPAGYWSTAVFPSHVWRQFDDVLTELLAAL